MTLSDDDDPFFNKTLAASLVARYPVTPRMIDAGILALIQNDGIDDCVALVSAIYRAMRRQSEESGAPDNSGIR